MQSLTKMDMLVIDGYCHMTTMNEWKYEFDEANTSSVKTNYLYI